MTRSAIAKTAIAAVAALALLVPAVARADAPPNDNFASAQALTGTSGTVTGSNVGATSESGEPVIAAGLSIWYSWVAPADGPATFDTQGSNFDTVLAVYNGSSVGALSLVAQNDDYYLLQSRVDFQASAGTTYYVQVDGFPDVFNAGSVVLNWQLGTAPPPAPAIDSGPAAASNSSSATFAFSDALPDVTFRCSLDSSAYTSCTSPRTYTGLADGLHTFLVAARNATGQESTATSYTWTIDTTPPPPPTIGTHPDAATTSTSASFAFADSEASATLLCSLDGGAFATCTSPQSYTGLSEGQHTFAVEARDTLGNVGVPTSFIWTIDLTAPAAPTFSATPDASTSASSATFEFAGAEAGLSFFCSLDGAPSTACTSPVTYSGLGEGAHAVSVYAADAAGNTSPAVGFGWTVDTTPPPVPAIGSHPDAGTTATSASFTFSDSEAGTGFLCSLDGGPYAPCSSPQDYSGLTTGTHTFSVEAVDAAGNASAPATFSWLVDTSPRPAPALLSHPNAVTASTTASFTFSSTIAGAVFLCSLDGSPFELCTSPASYAGLGDGLHTFAVKARDPVGITSDATAFSWTVDTTPRPAPAITSHPGALTSATSATFAFSDSLSGVTFFCSLDGGAYSACTSPTTYSGLADGSHTFSVYIEDAYGIRSDPTSFDWTVDSTLPSRPTLDTKPDAYTNATGATFVFSDTETTATFLCSLDGSAYADCTSPQSFSALAEGSHTFSVEAKDAVGNVGPAASFTWTVDLTPPPVPTILTHPDAVTSMHDVTFTFTDTEAGAGFRCSLDGAAYTACTSPKSYASLAEGSHTFTLYATDAAGNLSASASFSWADPRGAKRSALALLKALPADGDSDSSNNVRAAIRSLQDALDDSLWIDGSHLDTRGEKVFQKEKESVTKLVLVLHDSRTQLDKTKIQGAIDSVVAADRVLAKTAIDESSSTSNRLSAQTELAAGDQSAASGQPVDAIEHYKNAWKKAKAL